MTTQSLPAPPPSLLPPAPSIVLIVDDDAATRALTQRWIERAGFVAESVDRGEAALERTLSDPRRIAVIVLDVMMPGMDGFEVLERLRADPEAAEIPVVLLTAHANQDEDVVRGIERGAADHIEKPYSGPVMVAKVTSLAKKRGDALAVRERLARAEQQATTDALTGLANRRAFDAQLVREANYARRRKEPFGLVMIDVDFFKSYNDLFGHAEGDRVLQHVAACLAATLRKSDYAFRIGGEEFAVLLRGSDREQARLAAERLRAAVREAPITLGEGDGEERRVTFSAGVAVADADNDFATDELTIRADTALYAAKRAGRDRVVASE